jgi:hypothetical protein
VLREREVAVANMWAPQIFSIFQRLSTPHYRIVKWQNCHSRSRKFTEKYEVTEKINGNRVPFGSNFKIETDFELKI